MKLFINNFAKIEQAEIIIDGITVIAGENDTGKSTVRKILFSLFNSLTHADSRVKEERLNEIEKENLATVETLLMDKKGHQFYTSKRLSKYLTALFQMAMEKDAPIDEKEMAQIINDGLKKKTDNFFSKHEREKLIQELTGISIYIMNISEDRIIKEMVTRYFANVFHSQIHSLFNSEDDETTLGLQIKDILQKISFKNNECCNIENRINIAHKAVYIDNPFIVDELAIYNSPNPMNQLLKDLLTQKNQDSPLTGVIGAVRAKEKLNSIFEKLQTVIDGEISMSSNDEFYLQNREYSKPVSFYNLSTGIKSFVILKMLLEKGCLQEKDVLILDEPEIHLHPQWQIAYAELIVLLQKYFDLSVVLTTHSPYFVDAINLFSCKYDNDKRVNYYLATNENGKANFNLVTGNIDLIYQRMASPIQVLDTLRYELNNND